MTIKLRNIVSIDKTNYNFNYKTDKYTILIYRRNIFTLLKKNKSAQSSHWNKKFNLIYK